MPIDAYSPCPGGTGKKIKFCCPEFLGELQTIERMLEGEQYVACLAHVEKLLEKHPDKACLLAFHCLLLRSLERNDGIKPAVLGFVEKHPGNPIALAEQAILMATEGDPPGALAPMQAALAATGQEMHLQVYESVWTVAQALVVDGFLPAARAWLSTLLAMNPEDPRPAELLMQLDSSPQLPLWVKDNNGFHVPADAPWKARLEEAIAPMGQLQWSEAMARLTRLAEELPGEPAVLQSLATLQSRLAYEPEAAATLRRFAALDVPLEDAVEATALAMFLEGAPLGDEATIWRLTYDVAEPDALAESLAGSRQLMGTPIDPSRWPSEDGPPPKGVYTLLDRTGGDAPDTPLADLPRVLGQALLFGRQTDRSARLEVVHVLDGDRGAVQTLLIQLGGAALGDLVGETREGASPMTRELLTPHLRLPQGATREYYRRLMEQHQEEAIHQRWPALPLGCLEGHTPQEAAADPAAKIPLLAAVMYLEFYARGVGIRADVNRLRRQFNLPELGPIDPTGSPLRTIPMVRWHRLDVSKLSDEELLGGFQAAGVRAATDAAEVFGREIVARPSTEGRRERLESYSWLIQSTPNPQEALAWVDRARQEADRANRSNAGIDMLELSLHIRRMDGQAASRVLEHIQSHHIREPGVASAVQSLLIQTGVIRPDGMPAAAARAAAMGAPPAAVAPAEEAKSGELWVPDGAKPDAGEKSKLWVPGMD